ncbi:hypothetical protein [uncultured Paludibaculum sp.]|uniref:hypothetical protein n=1 Tax=uncultured Paludibaculum sp. TaxID=1765020 RepID=UPI002AABAB26|nr:hypothetical protein [uncultured Paludibaculum sp.]
MNKLVSTLAIGVALIAGTAIGYALPQTASQVGKDSVEKGKGGKKVTDKTKSPSTTTEKGGKKGADKKNTPAKSM